MKAALDWVRDAVQRLGGVPMGLRTAVLVSCAVALWATIAPAWDVPDGYMYIAVVAAVVASTAPDTGGGFCFAGAIVAGWAAGPATASIGPALVITALALLVGHVAGALAAAMPATASAGAALAARWWRPTAVIAASTGAGAVLVALLDAWDPPGSIVVVLAALLATGGGAWWWSATDDA